LKIHFYIWSDSSSSSSIFSRVLTPAKSGKGLRERAQIDFSVEKFMKRGLAAKELILSKIIS